MAITIAGMAGSSYDIDASQWPRIIGHTGGASQHVEGSGWLVTATANAREVSVAAGYGYCCGVEAYNSAAVTLTAGANSSGSTRYDMVVFTYDWGTPANSAFSIKASTSSVLSLTQTAGTTWEMPVALLTVADGQGAFSAADILDIRPIGSGEVDLPLRSGWAEWNTNRSPRCVVQGDMVTLMGALKPTTTQTSRRHTVADLPGRVYPPGLTTDWIVEYTSWTYQGGSGYGVIGVHVKGNREVEVSRMRDSWWSQFNTDDVFELGGGSFWKGY